ncbi:MAG: prolyl oligopeptidase family serine peptidase [Woeseia sp.]
MQVLKKLAKGFAVLLLGVGAATGVALVWLQWDANRDHSDRLRARQGDLVTATHETLKSDPAIIAERVRLASDSGLEVTVRVLRPTQHDNKLPVLMLLGGHRTGSEAVALFDEVGERAIIALDYPVSKPVDPRGTLGTLAALPIVRNAFFDAAPAIWLATDWVHEQDWADRGRLTLAGVSLGVPFAATAAARDERIQALMLVHGAADNRAWIAENLGREINLGWLQGAAASVLNWIVYGPLHDTVAHVSMMSPRPVLIVGARADERVPAGETDALYDAARMPKVLRWTEGRHVQPSRRDIIDTLLSIADEELSFGPGPYR